MEPSKWVRPDDSDILQRLGIIGGSKTDGFELVKMEDESPEPSINQMVTASEGEESDQQEDVLFDRNDRDSLLNHPSGRKGSKSLWARTGVHGVMNSKESTRTLIFRGVLVCAAFFTLGLCLAIIGPTLPDLQSRTHVKSFSSIASVVSANGFGGLIGVGFGGACYSRLSPFCMMAVVLCACAVCTLVIPWLTTLTGVTLICFIQGICLGILERGGYCMFYAYWRRRYRILILFYFALALGACIAPLVTTPFVFSRLKPRITNLTEHTRVKRDLNETDLLNNTDLTLNDTSTLVPPKPVANLGSGEAAPIASRVQKEEKEAELAEELLTTPSTTSVPRLFVEQKPPDISTMPPTASTTTVTSTTSTTSTTTTTTPTTTTETTTQPTTAPPKTTTVIHPSNSTAGQYTRLLWAQVLDQLSVSNRVQFAYLVVSVLSFASTFGFALMCCCMPCRALQRPPYHTDFKFQPAKLCASSENRSVTALALLSSFLLVGIESTASCLFTSYLIRTQLVDSQPDQAQGVLLTTVFWFGMALSRLSVALFKQAANSGRTLVLSLVSSTVVAAISAVFGGRSQTLLWLATGAFGLSLGPVFPVAYCWLDCKLQLSPWFSSLWLVAAELGRVTLPVLSVFLMQLNGPRMLLLMLLVLTLLCSILYIFLNKSTKAASHLLAVDELSKHIRSQNGEAEYRRIHEPGNAALLEGEPDNLDTFLFEEESETVHFDKSSEHLVNGDGIFAHYKSSGRPRSIQ